MISLSRMLEEYRRDGKIPEVLTKRFIKALTLAERARLAGKLRLQLNDALDGTTGEIEVVNLCARIIRVRTIRREKGEL